MATEKQIEANRKNAKKAGRKKGKRSIAKIVQEKALIVLRDEVLKEWKVLIERKMDLAKGVFEIKNVPREGKVKVFSRLPDSGSLEYLFSMCVGKPKENVDIKVKGIQELTEKIQAILEGGKKK